MENLLIVRIKVPRACDICWPRKLTLFCLTKPIGDFLKTTNIMRRYLLLDLGFPPNIVILDWPPIFEFNFVNFIV